MAGINNSNEPSTAPQADRWYNLTLGSSLKDPLNSSKFCTLRYEFKPASIDKNQRGTLHKSKENKVTVEFQNNQPGKPKVTFEGISEDYKENDAVLFYDGESFRLERLHRAVKRLRHKRPQGESSTSVAASSGLPDASSPPVGKGVRYQHLSKDAIHGMPLEVERIDIGDFKNSDSKSRQEKVFNNPAVQAKLSNPSPDNKNGVDLYEQLDIVNAEDDEIATANHDSVGVKEFNTGIDINVPIDSDDEIADVDVSDNETVKGPNAAEALRAQVNAEERKHETSSSSSSSGSESSGSSSGSGSGSGSGSSSSDNESSEGDDSVNSI